MESLASTIIFKYPLIIAEILIYFFIIYTAVKEIVCSHRGIRHPNSTKTGNIITQDHLNDHVTILALMLIGINLFIAGSVIAVLNLATMTVITEANEWDLVLMFIGSEWYFYLIVIMSLSFYLVVHHLKTERMDCYLDETYSKKRKVVDKLAYYKTNEDLENA